MTDQPQSLVRFNDCEEILSKALNEGGIEIECASRGQAIALRQRCNHFRKLDRDSGRKIYPEGHPLRGRSIYDALELSIPKPPNDNVIIIRPRHIAAGYKIGPLGTWTSPAQPLADLQLDEIPEPPPNAS